MTEDNINGLSFEDALAELDQIVRGLEGGTLKLDAAVQAFERGVKLRRHCEAKLAEVEARVEALVQGVDGQLTARPLE
ncbi:MAG TPA: exodeoxyribonuclease VII small subunit [Rhodopila sp.]|nr:exodeoxyribonuclease VII small subunit [Rhodopila sp.]